MRKARPMNRPFNLLDYSIAFCTPRRLTDVGSWHLHIPFAFVITAMLKPKKFVELGTHKGDSYCAFCQAVDEFALGTVCYAVDSWQGDEQTGFYGEEVLEELRAYHDPLYGGFSSLMKCLFDDALDYFSEGSIDLLHIDGHHTHDSVRHDFEAWLPKMSARGVVLFHDSSVREREFGVWRLWDEISSQYPSFEFKFGNGLGVLAVGEQIEEEVRAFLAYGKDNEIGVSRFFYHLGTKIELDLQKAKLSEQVYKLERLIRELSLKNVEIETELSKMQEMRAELEKVVSGQRTALQENALKLRDEQEQVRRLREDVLAKGAYIEEVHSSFGWMLLESYRNKILSRFLPPGTNRHRAYTKVLTLLKTAGREGLKTLPAKVRKFFREINASSNIRREIFVVPGVSETGISPLKVLVSVVIPTCNAGPDFVHVLNTIKRQKGIKPAEVILVDSSSEDDTVRIARHYGARVFSIDPAEFGHGRTRNFGARQAGGEYIIFLSQDAIPAGDFCFRDMILGMQEDQALAAISARQIPRSDADLYACWEMWNHYEKFMQYSGDRLLSVSKGKFDSLSPADKRRTAQIDNVFSCIRRSVFLETLFSDIPYAEDLDLGLRLLRKGYKLAFFSSIAAIHSHNRDAMYYFRRSCTDRRALVSLVGYEPMDWKMLGIGSLPLMAAYIRSASCRLTEAIDEFAVYLQKEGISALSPGYFQKRLQLSRANGTGEANCGDVIRAVQELSDLAGDEDRQVSVSIDVLTHQFLSIVESFAEYIRIYADSETGHEGIIGALRKQCAVVLGANLGDFAAYSELKNTGEDLAVIDRIVGRSV
ncbi:MAG: class I SAM-dependent methyltransferase [Syntrophales bacterium]|nr:class I SAM-dependent methyltransferase [Syntrophales bacterium]